VINEGRQFNFFRNQTDAYLCSVALIGPTRRQPVHLSPWSAGKSNQAGGA